MALYNDDASQTSTAMKTALALAVGLLGLVAGYELGARYQDTTVYQPVAMRAAPGMLHPMGANMLTRSSTAMHAEAPMTRRQAIMGMAMGAGALQTGAAQAISGGGKGYTGQNIEFENFDGRDLNGVEFRGTSAKRATFVNAQMHNCQFQKADLRYSDFTGADLSGAALELCTLTDAVFDNAIMEAAYIGDGMADAKSIEGADFTDAIIASSYVQSQLCKKAKGTNPVTGVDTRDSLLCE